MKKFRLTVPCVAVLKKSKECIVLAIPMSDLWKTLDAIPETKVIAIAERRYDENFKKQTKFSKFNCSTSSDDWFRTDELKYSNNFALIAIPKSYQYQDSEQVQNDDSCPIFNKPNFSKLILPSGEVFKFSYLYELDAEANLNILDA